MRDRRVLPHNLDAEASILGGIILRNECLHLLPDLEVEDFYDHRHKAVFQAMRNLTAKSRPLDVVTVENELQEAGKLDAVGGIAFLGELALRVPTADNVVAYAEIVAEKRAARELMLVAGEIMERGYEDGLTVEEYLDWATDKLAAATQRRAKAEGGMTIGQAARARLEEYGEIAAARARGESAFTGAPTGVEKLDTEIGGLRFGNLNGVAGRPGMGKTALVDACVRASTAVGIEAIVFSLEDTIAAKADRAIGDFSGVPIERLLRADLRREDMKPITLAIGTLHARKNWFIDGRKGLSVAEIIRTVRHRRLLWRMANPGKKEPKWLIVVDYIQLVRRNPKLNENDALNEIITAMLAAVLPDEAWVVVSQLNRNVEERPDKRPQMPDLRGSGALEERPKLWLFPFRGAYYGGEPRQHIDYECDCPSGAKFCSHRPSNDEWERTMQILIGKNTGGRAPARVFCSWDGPTTRVS